MSRALVAIALVASLFVSALAVDSITAVAARNGYYRQFTVAANPSLAALQAGTATGIAVGAVGVTATGNAGSGSVQLDVAGFKFKNPADLSDGANNNGLVFYFGYLGVNGAWSNSTATASLSGAVAEIVSSWESIFVYYNHDSQNGFQWQTDKDVFNCTAGAAQKFDCIDLAGAINIKDLPFGGIIVNKTNCPSGYNANCSVYTATTSSTDGVLTFTMRLASEPILINGVRVEPNYTKIDVTINYPWSSKTLTDANNARVGIVAYTAGRAATASAAYSRVNDKDAVLFEVGDKSAYFSWDSTAVLQSGSGAVVYADSKSGATIKGLDCSNFKCGLVTSVFVGALQIRQAFMEAFSWKTEMMIFSWNELRPTQVYWDPAMGMEDTAKINAQNSAAVSVAPAFVFAALLAKFFF